MTSSRSPNEEDQFVVVKICWAQTQWLGINRLWFIGRCFFLSTSTSFWHSNQKLTSEKSLCDIFVGPYKRNLCYLYESKVYCEKSGRKKMISSVLYKRFLSFWINNPIGFFIYKLKIHLKQKHWAEKHFQVHFSSNNSFIEWI